MSAAELRRPDRTAPDMHTLLCVPEEARACEPSRHLRLLGAVAPEFVSRHAEDDDADRWAGLPETGSGDGA